MSCWICGQPADTGEHKIKKSLLVTLHGKGPYTGPQALSHVKDGRVNVLQGPGSERITFPDTLCASCNNHRTQPFDQAFDAFSSFVLQNEASILKHRVIDYAEVYGSAFEVGQRNLFKYFVKLFGCDLSYSGHQVPDDLRILLDRESFSTRLRITFAINEDKLLFPIPKDRPVGVGDLITTQRNLRQKDAPKYRWDTYFSFLHTYYWYWWEPDGPLGAKWIADSRYVYLGYFYPLTEEQREDFRKKLEYAEPCAAPNGGPARSVDNPNAPSGPPSVS